MSKTTLPRPQPCIITALEILGLDDPSVPDGRVRQVLAEVEDSLTSAATLGDDAGYLSLTARRVVHLGPIKQGGALPYIAVGNVAYVQVVLAKLGFVARGAITIGNAATEGTFAFGSGIVQAEQLRDELAIFPRVIVHPHLLREIELNPHLRLPKHTAATELGYVRELLVKDMDGLWFIDYLALRHDNALIVSIFEAHHRLVSRQLEASASLDRFGQAAAWLASYHNRALDDLREAGRVDDATYAELVVRATGPLLYSFPPSTKAP